MWPFAGIPVLAIVLIPVFARQPRTGQGTDTVSHATNGATGGSIAIRIHGGERWRPGGFWRWRVIAVKELPDQAIAWSKMYGRGRVFHSSLGHTKEAWEDQDVRESCLKP